MHFIKSGAWLDELLLDDCPGMDLTVEMLGIDDRPGFMIFSPKSDCVVSGAVKGPLRQGARPRGAAVRSAPLFFGVAAIHLRRMAQAA